MNLVDALKNEPQRGCSYKALKDALTVEEQQALDFALRNPAKSIREIRDILANAGHHIGREQLMKHRAGNCATCANG